VPLKCKTASTGRKRSVIVRECEWTHHPEATDCKMADELEDASVIRICR
jgi:hypothetical protein